MTLNESKNNLYFSTTQLTKILHQTAHKRREIDKRLNIPIDKVKPDTSWEKVTQSQKKEVV